MPDKTKVIIVAGEPIHSFFTEYYSNEWDTQSVVEQIDEMWAGLQNQTLSANTEIVLINDEFFVHDQEAFETAIISLAPSALLGIITYDETIRPVIEERIRQQMLRYDGQVSDIYFIDPQDPINSVNQAVQRYYAILSGENVDIELDQEFDTGEANTSAQEYADPEYANMDGAKRGQVIASTSSKGGSGKSTVSILLASTIVKASQKAYEEGLNEAPLRVCVVDMDTRDGQVGFLLGQSSPTALNIRIAPNHHPETIENNLVYDERSGIYALLAPRSGRTADDTGPEFYREVIENLRYMFDYVVLDTSVNYLDPLIFDVALPDSDAVLFVTSLSIAAVFGMARWFNEVIGSQEEGGAGISQNKIGIVVNGSTANVGMDKSQISMAAGQAHIIGGIPLDTNSFLAAGNQNRLSDMLEHNTIGPAYLDLAKKVIGNDVALSPIVEEKEPEEHPKRRNLVDSAVPAGRTDKNKSRRGFFRK